MAVFTPGGPNKIFYKGTPQRTSPKAPLAGSNNLGGPILIALLIGMFFLVLK